MGGSKNPVKGWVRVGESTGPGVSGDSFGTLPAVDEGLLAVLRRFGVTSTSTRYSPPCHESLWWALRPEEGMA